MDELIQRITRNVGVDEMTARSAVTVILSFLYREGSAEKMSEIAARIPGADGFIDPEPQSSPAGGGGGLFEVFGELQALGLDLPEIQPIAEETVAFLREKAGDQPVDDLLQAIPGLNQFL
ncbi:hypothetical protein SAMN05216548_1236 [Faunimonas pinastri]|uniref:DUF2267 domain-containing protein n=1 Tax=Faunimonas pinastri TaxID=1855383 RepID=A0A1H9PV81_9HYPH|nr:hypothetical protein [Faunimonas pinastri]SER52186.1 hypothetical protein SAMN05216548_1236 [Faunimonas pinastri]